MNEHRIDKLLNPGDQAHELKKMLTVRRVDR